MGEEGDEDDVDTSQASSLEEIVKRSLESDYWSPPEWLSRPGEGKINKYDSFYLSQLRSRYIEIESDFRTILPGHISQEKKDIPSCAQIILLLDTTKRLLENKNPNSLDALSLLELIERHMVWIYPGQFAQTKIYDLKSCINSLQIDNKNKTELISKLNSILSTPKAIENGMHRPIFDEIIRICNKENFEERINSGLQISRLKSLRFWGLLIGVPAMFISPVIIKPEIVLMYPSQLNINLGLSIPGFISAWFHTFAIVLSIVLIGAIGAFLSGLLQVRNSKTTLIQYEESMIKLQLRLLIGGMVALVLFILQSWSALSGVVSNNIGSYVLIAFLSGFSERYFLKLLKIDSDNEELPSHKLT